MRFLYPSLLWALFALLIPIAVHLFNFRRHKQVYFSNTELLKNIHQENTKTRKLKHLVALMLRCLFIAALVLAFAFPYPKSTEALINEEEDVVGVYIDNSMSMKALSSKTTLLDDARESARNLVEQYPPSMRFVLMTNSFEQENEYPMNRDEMLDRIDRMILDGPPVTMGEVMDRFAMLRKYHGIGRSTLFVFSDFQENMLRLSAVQPDSLLHVVVVPMVAEASPNLSIDTLWLASPVIQTGLANEVHAVVHNRGDRAVQGIPVNLVVDGHVMAAATADVEPQGTAEVQMQIVPQTTGSLRCSVTLTDYPVTFDDALRFVVEPRRTMNVVELNSSDKPSALSLIFADDPQYDYLAMNPSRCDLNALAKAQLVVVNAASEVNATLFQAIENDAAEGASVVFFHDEGAVDTNRLEVSDLALKHSFFDEMILEMPQHADLPKVHRHVHLTPDAHAVTLIHLSNGEPLLTLRQHGKGYVFALATITDEQWSTLADNALFVPLMLKMALLGGGVGRIAYTIGDDQVLVFSDLNTNGNVNLRLRNNNITFDVIPSYEIRDNRLCVLLNDEIREAGFYDLVLNDSVCHVLAWNDSRLESDMTSCEPDRVQHLFREAGVAVGAVLKADDFAGRDLSQTVARTSTLWRWFALFALLALIGEAAVLRFWK